MAFALVELGVARVWVLYLFPAEQTRELFLSWSRLVFVRGQLPAGLSEAALTNMSDVSSNFP